MKRRDFLKVLAVAPVAFQVIVEAAAVVPTHVSAVIPITADLSQFMFSGFYFVDSRHYLGPDGEVLQLQVRD